MHSIILATAMLISLSFGSDAKEEFEKRIGRTKDSNSLGKSAILTSTRYTSAHFNIDFIAPAGWTITEYDSISVNSVFLTVSKSGRSDVVIFAHRSPTLSEARYYGSWMCHSFTTVIRNASESATLATASDTLYPSLNSYGAVGYIYGTTVALNSSYSEGIYTNGTFFFTPTSSFTSYSADYGSIFQSIYTYSPTALSKGPRPVRPSQEKALFNALGQSVKGPTSKIKVLPYFGSRR